MKKTLIAIAAAAALMGMACQDNELKREGATGDNFGDARPDNGREGYFENDGIDDNKESNDEGIGGSGKNEDLDNNDPIDVNVDRQENKVDIETERD